MRSLVPLALVLLACGPSDRRDSSAAAGAPSSFGPDPIVLRVPRGGGTVSAYAYPKLDSAIWHSSAPAPSLDRVLAFDAEGGELVAVDAAGLPVRLDLRLGNVRTATKLKLASLSSADGSAIYGVTGGQIVRLIPSGADWRFKPPVAARAVFPQSDGTVIISGERGDQSALWQLRPPDTHITDSAQLPHAERDVRVQAGDRVYLAAGEDLVGVRSRGMESVKPISLGGSPRAVVPTPSGDRLYAATAGSKELSVIDRYTDRISETVELPGEARELRMDPLGRYLLARPETGDSAWVIAVGTNRLLGSVRTGWRSDLPFVAPDGALALVVGPDVSFVDGETLRSKRSVPGGASDFWHVILWNGFRPRAAGLDEPVRFRQPPNADSARDSASADSARIADTTAHHDSAAHPAAASPPPPSAPPPAPPAPATAQIPQGFTVSFAAVLNEAKAREEVAKIRVNGQAPRIVTSSRSGATIYRVIMGPYTTRADAERVGRASGHDYWVFEGAP